MAITISGENNNDKILAQDGVIDQISGINIVGLITASHINVGSNIQLGNAGIITATTFVGNLTGNVNSTSPLLLQTGGSERFRITGNNELGIAGANYGSAGQVLTSGGSGSAVTWSAIPSQVTISNNADNRVITGGSGTNLNGEANLTYNGNVLALAGNDNQELRIGAGADLTLKADGSNSAIVHNGDGELAILAQGTSENIKIQSSGYLYLRTGGANERLRITSGGSVNIGGDYTQTSQKLKVTGNTYIDGTLTAGVGFVCAGGYSIFSGNVTQQGYTFHDADSDTYFGFPSADQFDIFTAGSSRLHINSDGRLRVGCTAQPSATVGGFQLDMGSYPGTLRLMSGAGASGTQTASLAIGGSNHHADLHNGANSGGKLDLYNYNSTDGNSTAVSYHNSNGLAIARILGVNISHSNRNGDLVFMTSTANYPTEKLRIASNGNIAIQTNGAGLSGAGTLRINSGSTAGALNLDGGATNHGGEINLTGGSNGGRIQFRTGQGSGQQDEKMRLDENGRLLIGTTHANNAFSGGDDLIIGNTDSGTRSGITLVSNSSQDGGIYFSDGTSGGNAYVQGQIVYDHGQHYMRFYSSSDEKFRIFGGTTDHVLQIRGGNNLSISDYAPNQNFSGTYTGYHTDNHGNTLIGLNAHLHYSSNSGTHQWKQTNAHSTIGSAGMFIGGNGSSNNTDICFFANPQGSNAGATFAQDSWKFRISNSSAGNTDITQNYNLRYLQRGYFKTDTANQTASNFPLAASGIGGYAFGYQEAFSTSNGSWVHPYPDLILGYHTGMRFGANRSYGGCRFYDDHPYSTGNIYLSIGNNSTGVHVTNSFTAGSNKGFRIAHPHPSKKYTHDLVHNAIEAPQMDLIYRGKVDLVAGSATVNIDTKAGMTDGTFVLLNRDVQCFTSNETGWTAVKGSVSGNILTITAQDNSCTDTISWMVVGERQDDKIKESELTTADGDLIVEPLTIEETHM